MSFQNLPGFRDFYPAECSVREALFDVWRKTAERYGFERYDGPPLEPLDLYRKKSGDEIVGQLYNFKDKGDREIALRPEMTPTLARMAGARQREFKKPMKWYAIPQLFRYERAQRGRLREHFQWNCDILGEESLGAEVELIALLVESFERLGLTSRDIVVRVSDRQFWTEFLRIREVPEEQHYEFFQALDKIEREDPAKTREKLGPLADEVLQAIESQATNERLREVLDRLAALGLRDFVEVDLRIVRGLAYYTGVVFEVHDRARQFRAIAGGGRYDGLVELVSGVKLPALGFGMGDVVILELLKDLGKQPKPAKRPGLFVVISDEAWRTDALRLAGALRRSGYAVEYSLAPAKVGKQFQMAEDKGARFALVVDAQVREGRCGLKDLGARRQEDVAFQIADGRVTFQPALPLAPDGNGEG